jgi:hypothetical protein
MNGGAWNITGLLWMPKNDRERQKPRRRERKKCRISKEENRKV